MEEIIEITKSIKAKNFKPIYFFMGDEPYFIDKLTNFIEENVLSEEEKSFNQLVLYGRDTSVEEIVSAAKRFPMMADYQVIIVREAQELSKSIEKLEVYAENAQPSSILVFAYKYKTLDKRKKLYKIIEKNGILYESKKLYENQIADWIRRLLKTDEYNIEPKAAAMLVEFLGTDLSKISNEINKLKIILPKNATITANDIEKNIGFSKDYNNFELRKAIAEKNALKSFKIIDYFAQNPKDNPLVVTVGMLFSFFSQILQYHGLKDKSSAHVAKILKINPYFVQEYSLASKNYPMKKVSSIVAKIRETDLKSKGLGAHSATNHDILKDLLLNIFS